MHQSVFLHKNAKNNVFQYGFSLCLFLLLITFPTIGRAQVAQYGEAPQLAQRVTTGELPPVEERLPVNPMTIPVVERIGTYGGTWRTSLLGGGDQWWLVRTIGYEHLVRWSPEWTEIIPNIAESYEVNERATEFTFHLREGLKWSDGQPFTADDIMFWYEDILLNEELTPSIPSWLVANNEPVVVEKLDDFTIVFRFASPNGFFVQSLAQGTNTYWQPTNHPRHYLEQFHVRYNPEGIDALVQQAGVTNWVELFTQQSQNPTSRWVNSDLPTLAGWMLTTAYGEGTTRVVAERNPYYWKVDPEGNQLPYIDRVVYDILGDEQVLLLRALSGEIDMQDRHIATLQNRPVLFDNQERGNYRFFETIPVQMNTMIIALNMNHEDPVKREVFQNKDFRIGLSHAINRQELIDLIDVGQGEPYQAAPRPESEPVGLYNERLAKQYTEYSTELANEYLDRAGYDQRDAEGFRLGPDGNRISFQVEARSSDIAWIDALELIRTYWNDVGIDVQMRSMDRSLFETRVTGNLYDAVVWSGDGGLNDDILLDPRWYLPLSDLSYFAPEWALWYNQRGLDTEEAEAVEMPPEAVVRQMDLYDQLRGTADRDEQLELMREILEIAADQFYVMGINLFPTGYGIVRNNFHNVPESMFFGTASYLNPAPTNPVQYFIEGANN